MLEIVDGHLMQRRELQSMFPDHAKQIFHLTSRARVVLATVQLYKYCSDLKEFFFGSVARRQNTPSLQGNSEL